MMKTTNTNYTQYEGNNTIMCLDSETLGFGIHSFGKFGAIKFDNGIFHKKDFSYALNNPFVELKDEEKHNIVNDLENMDIKIEFAYKNKFEIIGEIDDNSFGKLEEYVKSIGWNLSKKNGYSLWKKLFDRDSDFKAKEKENKEIVLQNLQEEGYTINYEKLIYDVGYTVSRYNRKTKKMDVYKERSYLVKEVFMDMKLMEKAYFFNKHPLYLEMLSKGEIELKPMQEILDIMAQDIKDFNVDTFTNYNAGFDTSALSDTIKIMGCKRPQEFKQLKNIWCLWNMCCKVLYNRPSFVRMALKNGWISDSGKFFQTNAEVGYRYMTNDIEFIEDHTALSDARIETELLGYALRQGKSKVDDRGIIGHPYKTVKMSNFIEADKLEIRKYDIEEINKMYKGNSVPFGKNNNKGL